MVEFGEDGHIAETLKRNIILQTPNKKFYKRFGHLLDQPSRFVFMRHATSKMNESFRGDNKEKAHLGYFDIALDPALKDAAISEEGLKEVRAQQELLRTLDIKLIVTSPMRRALMTSLETGLNVPIVCLPDLRERMSYKNTWVNSKKTISEMFPTVNVEMLNDDYWFLKCLRNVELRDELVKLCESSPDDEFEVLKKWMLDREGIIGDQPKGFTEIPSEFIIRMSELK